MRNFDRRAWCALGLACGMAATAAAQNTSIPIPITKEPPAPKKQPKPAQPNPASQAQEAAQQPAGQQQNQQPQPAPPQSDGKVVFSRSTDESGQTTTSAGPGAQPSTLQAPLAQDSERQAVTFTDFDLDVRLTPAAHQIAVRAQLTVRNDGKTPLAHIPLQISSSLNWERIVLLGRDLPVQVATLNSDVDHTGQLHEAELTLAQPLAPGAALQLDVAYSGTITLSAQRLLAIGTPEQAAMHSDWDRIGWDFTGLRGFGNVLWYPASAPPAILGDGARVFDEIGEHKLRMAAATFRMRLTVEFPRGQAPTIALVNGHPVPLQVTDAGQTAPEVAGVATSQTERSMLGFDAPSLFVAIRKPHAGTNLTAWTGTDNDINVHSWLEAATAVTPFLQGWLGQKPRAELTLLDLSDPQDAPYETGALLAASLHEGPPQQLDGILAHALTHAWVLSPRAWLSEGVAHFMGTLWMEKQQGREKALSALEGGRGALAIAEPESPGIGPGQPLASAISPVFYRTKATYVLWMLRDVAGDGALSAALRAYDPHADIGNQTVPSQFEKLLEQAGPRQNLGWFFADWVDADKGLPDLTVESVIPSQQNPGNWLVAVNLDNSGYASAEVPVTVRTAETTVTKRVRVDGRSKKVERILIQGTPTEVQVNDGTVPETESSVHVTKITPAK